MQLHFVNWREIFLAKFLERRCECGVNNFLTIPLAYAKCLGGGLHYSSRIYPTDCYDLSNLLSIIHLCTRQLSIGLSHSATLSKPTDAVACYYI